MHNVKHWVLLFLCIHFLPYVNANNKALLRDQHFQAITILDNTLLEYEHRQRNGYSLSMEGKQMRQDYQKEDMAIKRFLDFQDSYIKYPTSQYYQDATTINRKLIDQLFDSYFTTDQANTLRARVLDKGDSIASIYAITLVAENITQNKREVEKLLQDIFASDEFVTAYMRANISFKKHIEQVSSYYLNRQSIH